MGTDTIAAIATAMTSSGIGIVRISGDEAVSITDRIFEMKNQEKLEDMPTHTIHYGHIHDGDEVIDEVMVVLMRGPKSYTREDTVEIDCHGGVYVMKRILETVIKYGARPAEPGEFTKRAFLNGRIDLSQAESVIDVINSKNEFALKSSLSQLSGSVSEKIKEIRGTVLHEIAFIESALDDPEHISLDGYPEKLSGIVSDVIKKIDKLLANSDNGKMLKEGISTVIVGKPNAGKSSLLNSLVGEEKAIVTDIAGTTLSVNRLAKDADVDTEGYKAALADMKAAAEAYNKKIADINAAYEKAMAAGDDTDAIRAEGKKLNKQTLKVFAEIQKAFMETSPDDVAYGHPTINTNAEVLQGAIAALEKEELYNDDETGALDVLYNLNGVIEYNYYIFGVKPATDIMQMYDQKYISTDKTYWGTDAMPPIVYTGETTHKLARDAEAENDIDYKAVTNVYESALADTMKNIKLYADREVKDMAKVAKLMK